MMDAKRAPLVLLTGANGGIGREYARQMLTLGYDLVVTGRRLGAIEELAETLRAEFPLREVHPIALDIGDLDAVERFGTEFTRRFERLDVLLHCAGVYFFDSTYRRSRAGIELNYATHVVGPHALTLALRDALRAADGARVVLVSSTEHRKAVGGRGALDPSPPVDTFSNMQAYRESKWATMLLATGLQQLLADPDDPIEVLAAHPGVSITGIQHKGNPNRVQRAMIWLLGKLIAGSPEGGARPLVVASTQGRSGEFYGPTGFMEARGKPGPVALLPDTQDPALARELVSRLQAVASVAAPPTAPSAAS